MKNVFGFLLAVLLFWNECSGQKLLQEKPEPRQLTFTRINSIIVENGLVKVAVTAQTPNPCYIVSSFSMEKHSFVLEFSLFGQLETMLPCAMVIGSLEAEKNILLTEPGEYTFRFMDPRGSVLDTTIVMKDW